MQPKAKKVAPATKNKFIWIVELPNGEEYSSLGKIAGRASVFGDAELAKTDAEAAIVDDIGEDFEHATVWIINIASGEKFIVEERPKYILAANGEKM